MGNKHNKKPDDRGGANRDPKPSDHCKFEVPRVQAVRIEHTSEDHQWQTDQQGNWKNQLKASKSLNWITGIAAGGALFYAGIAYFQWQDAHRAFRQDQRPWIQSSIKQLHFVTPKEDTSPLLSLVHIVNMGKSPAQKLLACVTATIVKIGENPKGMDDVCNAKNFHTEVTSGAIFPTESMDFNAYFYTEDPQHEGYAVKGFVHKDTALAIDRGDAFVVVFGRINYTDILGFDHWTQFCHVGTNFHPDETTEGAPNMPPYLGNICMAYNRVDNN